MVKEGTIRQILYDFNMEFNYPSKGVLIINKNVLSFNNEVMLKLLIYGL